MSMLCHFLQMSAETLHTLHESEADHTTVNSQLVDDLSDLIGVSDTQLFTYFGYDLTRLLDNWDDQRPALRKDRSASILNALMMGEVIESESAPDDEMEKADVIIFANRLWRAEDASVDERKTALTLMMQHTQELVARGLVPFEVCKRKIHHNEQNYAYELLGEGTDAVTAVLFLKLLRRRFIGGILPSYEKLTEVYERESRPALIISANGSIHLSLDGQFPHSILTMFAKEE